MASGGMARRFSVVVFGLSCLSLFLPSSLLVARRLDAGKLVARIAREKNPVKKARMEVKLGRFHLDQAIRAYDRRQNRQGQKLLGESQADLQNAWKTLEASGRNAAKKPQGFMKLEIGLREDLRLLRELRRQVFYLNRGPIDAALSSLGQLHAKVLVALFPGAVPPAFSRHSPTMQASRFSGEAHPR